MNFKFKRSFCNQQHIHKLVKATDVDVACLEHCSICKNDEEKKPTVFGLILSSLNESHHKYKSRNDYTKLEALFLNE